MNEPLPGMPGAPAPAQDVVAASAVRVFRIHTAGLCSACCRDIHELGVAKAAYPQVARWRVVDGGAVWRLCERHKNERLS
jgi:hypothetical protein